MQKVGFERYQVVRCKITGQKMIIKDIINKDYPDEKYNCKYLNRTSGLYEYVHKTACELEAATATEVGFKSESMLGISVNDDIIRERVAS